MNWLGKLFKKKKAYNSNCEFKLLIIDEESDSLTVSLGITKERAIELGEITKEAHGEFETLTDAYAKVVAACKHVNELAFCFTVFARISELKNRQKQMISMFKDVFGDEQ